MRRTCNYAIDNVNLVSFEILFRQYEAVASMTFVMCGSLQHQLHTSDADDLVVVAPHHWACEEALWSTRAYLAAALTAQQLGADILLI